MPDRSGTPKAGGDRAERIRRVLAAVMRDRAAGRSVDEARLERKHPDLLPELRERLRSLKAVQHAASRAKQDSSSIDLEDLLAPEWEEERKLLEEALQGYRILQRLEHGGQAAVYKAVQEATRRVVAIKVPHDGPLASPRQRRRFEREVDLVSRLRHPNIITLYDSGVVRGRPYYVMEYIDGLAVDDYVLFHRPAVRACAGLFVKVCRAVAYAHQRGVIHRDLKPSNVLVDPEGKPHILDFGLAKELADPTLDAEGSSLSLPGQIVGTPQYLAPEQVGGEDGEIDIRTDLYALGVMLYQVLTGGFPYPVTGGMNTIRESILSRRPTGLRKALAAHEGDHHLGPGDVDEDLEAIVLTALRKEKARRYQSADALADDLQRYLSGEAVRARADSRFYLFRKMVWKYRLPAAVATAFVLLLIGSLVGMTVLWRRAERVAALAQAGLQMGSHLRLGSVDRDAGRVDQAVRMFEKSLEIGASVPRPDRLVRRFLYDAHHRLADLYYTEGTHAEEADRHCSAAVAIAEREARRDPGDLEWRRLLGFSYLLRGRMRFSHRQWEAARAAFRKASVIYDELHRLDPANADPEKNLAFALRHEAWCLQRLGRWEEARRLFGRARSGYARLLERKPDSAEYALELSRTEIKIATWHLFQQTEEDDRSAAAWLKQADDRLQALRGSEEAEGQRAQLDHLTGVIEANTALLRRRAAKRAAAADPA